MITECIGGFMLGMLLGALISRVLGIHARKNELREQLMRLNASCDALRAARERWERAEALHGAAMAPQKPEPPSIVVMKEGQTKAPRPKPPCNVTIREGTTVEKPVEDN